MRRPQDLLVVFAFALCAIGITAAPAAAAPPTVAMGSVSNVSYTSVHATAEVDPEGEFTEWFFQVSKDGGANWDGTNVVGQLEGSDPQTVEGDIQGLTPDTAYLVRVTAFNYTEFNFISSPEPSPEITTLEVEPPTVLAVDDATGVGYNSADVSGEVQRPSDPDPAFDTSCVFEYVNQAQFEANGFEGAAQSSCDQGAITETDPTEVTATLTGLFRGTTYHYRLRAFNQGGSDSMVAANTFQTDTAPQAQTLDAGSLTTESASLAGRINPSNAPVTYQFEWGTTTAYGNVAPASPEPLGDADESFHVVNALISGLAPETTYHFRIVAENTVTNEVVEGADKSFKTRGESTPPGPCPNEDSRIGFSANLPDCRAYEFVTPGMNGAAFSPFQGLAQSDGSEIVFRTIDASSDAEGSFNVSNYALAKRGPDGWTAGSIGPPTPAPVMTYGSSNMESVSTDFSRSFFQTPQPLAGDSSPTGINLYMRNPDNTFTALTSKGTDPLPPPFTYYNKGAYSPVASRDNGRIFFNATIKQLPEDPIDTNLYEWHEGQLHLVGYLPNEELDPSGVSPARGGFLPYLSEDGTEVLFRSNSGVALYLRIDGQETVEVTESQRTVDPDPKPLECALDPDNPITSYCPGGVTTDGSKVLFISKSELTNDANTGETEGEPNHAGADLYSYDVESGVLTDLTPSDNPQDAATGANVRQIDAVTADGSTIYFVATGSLAPGAVSGERNLYVYRDGVTSFIAPAGEIGGMYVTPDGDHAAFASNDSLTGYDNRNPLKKGQPETEIFKYTYGEGLECASCRTNGTQPTGSASFGENNPFGTFQRRGIISDDGSRIFFQTTDKVVPSDVNGDAGCPSISDFGGGRGPQVCTDVYEYSDGEPKLISTGTAPSPALLLDASDSGDDVFILTHEELVDRDQGRVAAIYDARVNADDPPPAPKPICTEQNCRGAGSGPSDVGSPGSGQLDSPQGVAGPQSKSAKSRKLKLRLTAPEGGELTVSGKGMKTVAKSVSKAGPLTVTLTLKSGANKTRIKKGLFKTRAEVLFRSSSGQDSRAEVTLKFQSSNKKGGK